MTTNGMSLLGVNLSGAEFGGLSGTYGYNYIYPSHAEIDYYASKNLNVIRLPFRWERLQPTLDGTLDPAELARIKGVVAYAASKGMSVILDPHDFGGYNGNLIGSAAVPNSAFADFWGKLAAQFKDSSNVIFGLMNEPHAQTATTWLGSANAAIAAIRQAGASQEILVPGSYWTGGSTWTTSDNASVVGTGIVDPANNYAFEIHEYLDAYASGTQPTVVSTSIGVDRLEAVTAWAEQHGVKLFLGEFGVGQDATSLTAMKNMLTYMSQHADAWQGATYWGAGPWWGNYAYSIEPSNGVDKPQMTVLEGFAPSAATPVPLPAVTMTLASDTGTSATDGLTNLAAMSGTGDAGAVVHFTLDGTAIADTATADATGAWSYTPTGLADGQHTVVASETNATGTDTASFVFTLDTQAPTPTIRGIGATSAAGVRTVTGKGEAGTSVTLFDGSTSVGTATTVAANGTWSSQITLASVGPHAIMAHDTDAAGNVGASTVVKFNDDHRPVITSGGGRSIALFNLLPGNSSITTVQATDADPGDSVTYALLGAKGNHVAQAGGFAIDAASGALSLVGTASRGLHSVTAVVSDTHGATAFQTIRVNVGSGATETAQADIAVSSQTFAADFAGQLVIQGFRATDTTSSLGKPLPHSVLALSHALFDGAIAGQSGAAAMALVASHSTMLRQDTFIVGDNGHSVDLVNVDRTALLANPSNIAFT